MSHKHSMQSLGPAVAKDDPISDSYKPLRGSGGGQYSLLLVHMHDDSGAHFRLLWNSLPDRLRTVAYINHRTI